MKMLIRIDTMLPGTQFIFRGKKYLRVCGPWEDGELPLMGWQVGPAQQEHLRLAVHITTGQLCPFFATDQGEVKAKRESA